MTDPTILKLGYTVVMPLVGTDEHGRTLFLCPRGCGSTAHIAEDKQVVCPTCDAYREQVMAVLASGVTELESVLLRGSND